MNQNKSIKLKKSYEKYYNKAKLFHKISCKISKIKFGLLDIFGILWIIFSGIAETIFLFCTSVAYCLTIIGIPFGIVYFKLIKLMINPVKKEVITHYGKHPVLNTLWLLFGGLATCISSYLIGFCFHITIIGIPIAKQYYKMGKYLFAPFGIQIVTREEILAGEPGKVVYTYQYLKRKLFLDIINTKNETEEKSDYIREKDNSKNQLVNKKVLNLSFVNFIIFLLLIIILFGIFIILTKQVSYEANIFYEECGHFFCDESFDYKGAYLSQIKNLIQSCSQGDGVQYLKNIIQEQVVDKREFLDLFLLIFIIIVFPLTVIFVALPNFIKLYMLHYGFISPGELHTICFNQYVMTPKFMVECLEKYEENKVEVDMFRREEELSYI